MNQNVKEFIPNNIKLYTVADVADILHTSKGFVYKLIHSGMLKSIRIGKIKVRHDTLVEFLSAMDGEDLTTRVKAVS